MNAKQKKFILTMVVNVKITTMAPHSNFFIVGGSKTSRKNEITNIEQ